MAPFLDPRLGAGRGEAKGLVWEDAGQAVVAFRLRTNAPPSNAGPARRYR